MGLFHHFKSNHSVKLKPVFKLIKSWQTRPRSSVLILHNRLTMSSISITAIWNGVKKLPAKITPNKRLAEIWAASTCIALWMSTEVWIQKWKIKKLSYKILRKPLYYTISNHLDWMLLEPGFISNLKISNVYRWVIR